MTQTKKINSISSNYVTTDTQQNITGQKTFKTNLETSTSAIDVNNPPDISMDGNKLYFLDKNNIELGSVYSGVYAENKTIKSNWSRLTAYNKAKTQIRYVEVQVNADGKGHFYAPSTETGTDLSPVVTTDYAANRFTTLNTNQTLTAAKTVKLPVNNHAIKVQDTGTDNTVKPSATQWQSMVLAIDKNGKERACCQATLGTDLMSRTKIMAIQQDSAGKNVYNSLELAVKSDGTKDTRITSNPPSSANGTEIATCGWVNTKISTTGGSNPTGYLLCNGATISRTTYANFV